MIKPMIYGKFKDEPEQIAHGTYKGLDYYVLSFGAFPAAYIDVKDTLMENTKYSEITSIPWHGGFTYSEPFLQTVDKKGWFIGWEYNNYPVDFVFGLPKFNKQKKWETKEMIAECKFMIDIFLAMSAIG